VNIALTQSQLNAEFQRALKPVGLSMQQFNVLRILKGKDPDPVCLNDISSRMVDKMSNASRLVEKLYQKGLINRLTCENDRRQIDVTITAEGKEILESANKVVSELMDKFSKVKTKHLEQANAALDEVRHQINK
jgi:DNA-binding MarR family transcriptional regulator